MEISGKLMVLLISALATVAFVSLLLRGERANRKHQVKVLFAVGLIELIACSIAVALFGEVDFIENPMASLNWRLSAITGMGIGFVASGVVVLLRRKRRE